MRILIVDDHPNTATTLARILARFDTPVEVLTARTSHEALTLIDDGEPYMLITDYVMPGLNGLQLLQQLENVHKPEHTILITAFDNPSLDQQLHTANVDDFLIKPVQPDRIRAIVGEVLLGKQPTGVQSAESPNDVEQDTGPEERFNIDELSASILERTIMAVGADNGHLVIFQADGQVYHKTHRLRDFSPWTLEEMQKRLVRQGLVAYVVASSQGAIVDDTYKDPRWLRTPNDPSGSAIAVPLFSQRGVIGVIALHHKQRRYFNTSHLTLLEAVASQAAVSVENVQLYAIERKRVRELMGLNHIARELNQFTYSSHLYKQIAHMISKTFGYPAVTLWLYQDGNLILHSSVDSDSEFLELSILEIAPQRVVASGQPTIISGSLDELGWTPYTSVSAPRSAQQHDTPSEMVAHSAAAVPLFRAGHVHAVLAIHSSLANTVQESDRVVLETLATQITAALERIWLFEKVEDEQRQFAAVLRGAADAILVIDAEGRLQLLNPAAQKLFTDVETKLGLPLPDDQGYDQLIDVLVLARRSAEPQQAEITWPDQRTFVILTTPIEEGGLIAVMQDVTQFKELDRIKNDFFAATSHDLKSPITSLLLYSSLLQEVGTLNKRQVGYIGHISDAAQQLNEMVKDLMGLAQTDLDSALQFESHDLVQIIADVVDEFHLQASAKQQILDFLPAHREIQIVADATRLTQALRNLVSNAIKYTPTDGQITISIDFQGSYVQIQVQDSGPGIAATDVPFIFDKFYRAQSSATKSIDGNGLGLAIVKSVVEQHGGHIQVKSTLGEGSCFSLSLPLAQKPTP